MNWQVIQVKMNLKMNQEVHQDLNLEEKGLQKAKLQCSGPISIAGKWPGFEEIDEAIGDLVAMRHKGGGGRNVSF